MSSLVLGTSLCAFATLITTLRISYRLFRRKFWYDDLFSFFSMVNSILILPAVWILLSPIDYPKSTSQHTRVIAFYLSEVCFTFTLWSARLSILYTVIRFLPSRQPSNTDYVQPPPRTSSRGIRTKHQSSNAEVSSEHHPPPPTSYRTRTCSLVHRSYIRIEVLYGVAVLFIILGLVTVCQKFWICIQQTTPTDWVHEYGALCSLGEQAAILELTST